MPDNILQFELPAKPRIKLQEQLPDQRKIVVLPFKAVFDKEISAAGVAVLAGLCAFCNRAGITFVSQRKLSRDLGISQPAVSRQISKLKKLGYIEVLRKGYAHARNETVRVIFDPSITAEEAIAMVSNVEDARPPGLKAEEEKRLQDAIDLEATKRIKDMISTITQPSTKVTPKEYNMRKKSKAPQPVDNTVDNHANETNERLHSVISPDNVGLSIDTVFNIEDIYLNVKSKKEFESVLKVEIESKVEKLLQAYQAEGIQPTHGALVDGVMHLLANDAI